MRLTRLAAVVALVAALPVANAAAAALSWSGPGVIDQHPLFAYTAPFTAISCPTSTFCAATSDLGVSASTHPTGNYTQWTTTRLPISGQTGAISCRSTALCVAVTGKGEVGTSTHPATGPWAAATIDAGQALSGVACPRASLCVAVDGAGNAVTSRAPTGGSASWKVTPIDPGHALVAVSCPSASLCVALDDAGRALTSNNPTGRAGAWTAALIDSTGNPLTSISCPSMSLCVAVDVGGNVITSSQPTGGSAAWKTTNLLFAVPAGFPGPTVSCASTAECVIAVLDSVASTTQPTGPASAWSTVTLTDQGYLSGVSCPRTTFCAAVDQVGGSPGYPVAYSGGDVVSSHTPTGPANGWEVQQVAGVNAVASVSCSASSYCIAGDDAGNVLTSSAPGITASAWRLAHIDPNLSNGGPGSAGPPTLYAVACHGPTACVAGDDSGNVMSTTNAAGGAAAWRVFTGVASYYERFVGAACPGVTRCFLVSDLGNLAVVQPASSTPPLLTPIDPGNRVSSISCPSRSFCVAVDTSGNVLSSTNPAGGGAWSVASVDPAAASSGGLTGVSCPSSSLCVAVDAAGNALTSIDPTGGPGAWTPAPIDPGHRLTAVSCASTSLCVASDDAGRVLTNTNPIVPAMWTSSQIDRRGLSGLTCSSAPTCVASDFGSSDAVNAPVGNVLVAKGGERRSSTLGLHRPRS